MNIIRAEKKYIGQMAEIEKECFTDPWSEAAFESSVGSQAEIILPLRRTEKLRDISSATVTDIRDISKILP